MKNFIDHLFNDRLWDFVKKAIFIYPIYTNLFIIENCLLHILVNVGLGVAGANYYTSMYKGCVLNPSAAKFVDVFYTDVNGHGTNKEVGMVNIYANTGTAPQPGCCLPDSVSQLGTPSFNPTLKQIQRNSISPCIFQFCLKFFSLRSAKYGYWNFQT